MSAGATPSSERAGGEEPPARTRGRPRSAAADAAIFGAVLELLPDTGLEGLSIEAVAKRAGVGKATIYRRWPSKQELVIDVISTMRPPPITLEDTGSVVGDLDAFNAQQVEALAGSNIPRLMPRLLSEAADDPRFLELANERLAEPLRDVVRQLLVRGIERGELRDDFDVEAAVTILHANAVYTLLMTGGDLTALPEAGRPILAVLREGIGRRADTASRPRGPARRS